jgi:hypothetical protein
LEQSLWNFDISPNNEASLLLDEEMSNGPELAVQSVPIKKPEAQLPLCIKPAAQHTVDTLEAAIQQLYSFIDARITDAQSVLTLETLKD